MKLNSCAGSGRTVIPAHVLHGVHAGAATGFCQRGWSSMPSPATLFLELPSPVTHSNEGGRHGLRNRLDAKSV